MQFGAFSGEITLDADHSRHRNAYVCHAIKMLKAFVKKNHFEMIEECWAPIYVLNIQSGAVYVN